MGILIITWNFPPRRGGIERIMARLYEDLKATHSVRLITTSGSSMESERGVWRSPVGGLVPFLLYAVWRGSWCLLRHKEIDVVFGGSLLVTPIVLFLARIFRRKAIVQAHGLDVIYLSALYQFFCVRWAKFSDAIVANSSYTADLLARRGVPQKRISVIPPGVDAERFGSQQDKSGTGERHAERKRKILFVGRLARRKGLKEFVHHCLPEIVRNLPQAELIIAGDNPASSLTHTDDLRSELRAEISKLKLQDHVRFMGAVDDRTLIGLYRECDVVVLPVLTTQTDVEGFGMVLIEAAAAGKPVVATRSGGIPDAVEDGVTGLLVEPGNFSAMKDAVIKLLDDPVFAVELGTRGRRGVEEQFTWNRIIRRYEAIFETAALTRQIHGAFTEAPRPRESARRQQS